MLTVTSINLVRGVKGLASYMTAISAKQAETP